MRYRCTKCGKSRVASRTKSRTNHALAFLQDYLTHYDTKARTAERYRIGSRSTAYRRIDHLLDWTPDPLPVITPQQHRAMMVDGFYIAYPSLKEHRHLAGAKTEQSVLLLAIDALEPKPLYWRIYHRLEDITAWKWFFEEMAEVGFDPSYLVHDGHSGLRVAANQYFPGARHQRCLVHLVRNVHKDIGITPKAPLAQTLQSLIYRLPNIRSWAEQQAWQQDYASYLETFNLAIMRHTPQTKAFFSLHSVLANTCQRNDAFTYLDCPGLPNNTNAIESQNRVSREVLRRHRGAPLNRREALVAWSLLFRSYPSHEQIRDHYDVYMSVREDTLFDA